MRSRIEGRNYIVQPDGEKHSYKYNKKRVDIVIDRLLKSSNNIRDILLDLYEEDYNLYEIFISFMFNLGYHYMSFHDGACDALEDMCNGLESLKNQLATGDDDIHPFEEVATLDDLGFTKDYASRGKIWMKILESTDDREVVEEIVYVDDGSYLYRTRTIEWKKTDYGRTSDSIIYKNKAISKNLMKAIKNTFESEDDDKWVD